MNQHLLNRIAVKFPQIKHVLYCYLFTCLSGESLSLSIQILDAASDVSEMVSGMEKISGVHQVKVLGRE